MPKDKLHPVKKNRPIPSGKLPVPIAVFTIAFLFFITLFVSYNISFFFFIICLFYFVLHFSYSLWLKQIGILDVLAIAAGFMFRIWAGAVAVDAHISVWLLLCVTSFSLFLAVAKRRCELTFLKNVATGHRQALITYPEKLLDLYTVMFATSSWLTYALFTFSQPAANEMGKYFNFMIYLPSTLIAQKWLMLTVPLVIYGVMRYLQLIYDQGKGESPEEIILTDIPLRTDFLIWLVLLIFLIYI